ncbi:MAG: pyridoxal-phosphate dependent enzyme [Candidatus Micrarchaeota archaeon]
MIIDDMMSKRMERKGVVIVPAPVLRNPSVEEFCGKNNLLIKDCSAVRTSGGFSSGTFKDYRSARLVNDFGARNPALYSIVYTTAGHSLGNVADEYNQINEVAREDGVLAVSIIDEELDLRIQKVLERHSVLVRLPLQKKIFTRQEILEAAKTGIKDDKRDCIDAENYAFSYMHLAEEVVAEKPDAIFMPLGGGEAVNSLLYLLDELHRAGENLPRLFAATVGANIFAGDTAPGACSIAEKLVTPWSELFERIVRTLPEFGEVVVVEEDEIMPAYLALKKVGIKAEPSAAVAFAAARKTAIPSDKSVLVVNSGSGIYFDENGVLRGVNDASDA